MKKYRIVHDSFLGLYHVEFRGWLPFWRDRSGRCYLLIQSAKDEIAAAREYDSRVYAVVHEE